MSKLLLDLSVFKRSVLLVVPVVVVTGLLQYFDIDAIHEVTSLHGSIVSGGFFITGFILSAAISDYKEGEGLPAKFVGAATNIYQDVAAIAIDYSEVEVEPIRSKLLDVLSGLRNEVVSHTRDTHGALNELGVLLTRLHQKGVPANYIVRLKQEQSQLVNALARIRYVQSIDFIPSATLLARIVTVGVVGLLLVTRVEPIGASLIVTGLISFIFIYLLLLIEVIRVPFHPEGRTKDDVSMFQVDEAIVELRNASLYDPLLRHAAATN